LLITKLEVATHQLGVAIRLFLEGDYLSSLTLAGAAEEILGKLSMQAGMPVACDFIEGVHLKDTDASLSDKERKKIIRDILNRGRNQVKHANDPSETHFDVEQIWPLQMIMRAMPMAKALGATPQGERDFLTWWQRHPEACE
jgi:hypothetical protein